MTKQDEILTINEAVDYLRDEGATDDYTKGYTDSYYLYLNGKRIRVSDHKAVCLRSASDIDIVCPDRLHINKLTGKIQPKISNSRSVHKQCGWIPVILKSQLVKNLY